MKVMITVEIAFQINASTKKSAVEGLVKELEKVPLIDISGAEIVVKSAQEVHEA